MQSGLKSVQHGLAMQPIRIYDQGTSPALLHHDVVEIVSVEEREQIVLGTRYGVSVLNLDADQTTSFELPAGVNLNAMYHWVHPVGEHLLLGTNIGFHTLSLDSSGLVDENSLVSIRDRPYFQSESIRSWWFNDVLGCRRSEW